MLNLLPLLAARPPQDWSEVIILAKKKKKARPLILIVMVNTNQRGVLISTLYEVITLFFFF